ncbi:MAG: stage III sporulation protein AF [Blautia sp.]|nr:stage III sporulation protein AF [Lachnoclostridium sp.]MCM1210701.1 stage III sporulation protein AF [Blautia sp.]
MSGLVENIQKIGIFMIVAQAVLHFAPGAKYEKYIRLIVGIMILLQFLNPLYALSGKTADDWEAWITESVGALDMDGSQADIQASSTVAEALVKNMEEEIKEKLNDGLTEEGYTVINVIVKLEMPEEKGGEQYRLDKVRVALRQRSGLRTAENFGKDESSGMNEESGEVGAGIGKSGEVMEIAEIAEIEAIEKIQIPQVSLQEENVGQKAEESLGGRQDTSTDSQDTDITDQLRKKCCAILGMEEEYMEVVIYGTVQADDK